MNRLPDWPERLAAYFDSVANRSFQLGTHDCALFARGAVHALTGVVVQSPAFGAYVDEKSARRLLAALSFEGQVSLCLGDPMSPKFAQRGDVVMYVHEDHGDALGVCAGSTFCAPGYEHLEHRPMSEAVRAWRIG